MTRRGRPRRQGLGLRLRHAEGRPALEGELRNTRKPTNVENLWIHGGNLHQSRHFSQFLPLQLKARYVGLETPVYGLQESHHER